MQDRESRRVIDAPATELEITEAVFERFLKWSRWTFGGALAFLGGLGIVIGWNYHSFREVVAAAQGGISQSVTSARQDLENARAPIPGIQKDVDDLRGQIQHYKEVNERIDDLQKGLKKVETDVIDLSSHALKVKSIQTTGPGEPTIGLGRRSGAHPPSILQALWVIARKAHRHCFSK